MTDVNVIFEDSEGFDLDVRYVSVGQVPWIAAIGGRALPRQQRSRFVRPTFGPEELVETPYQASGGLSALMQLDDQELQVEIHRQSYSLLWSTELQADAVFRNVEPFLPRVRCETTVVYADGLQVDGESVRMLRATLRGTGAKQIAYVRLQFDDRAVTWEQRRVSLIGSDRWFIAGQVGFVADRLDQRYIEAMIERTASYRLAPIAAELARRAADVVAGIRRFPIADLGFAGESSLSGTAMS